MKKVVLVLGGVRSGKSNYAVEYAKKFKKVVFIATAIAFDKEMKERIANHKLSRPEHWGLIEESKNISKVLPQLKDKYEIALIDCLGLWISNLLTDDLSDKDIQDRIDNFVKAIKKSDINVVLVSNEVGCGIVPDNLLSRRFRDLIGFANQMLAKNADEVIVMHAGIELKIKGE
jgi:adenosylcobinamide kinase / adenosylcobinamide-phosphate guanylyltransferase